jgi:hypothetical protein
VFTEHAQHAASADQNACLRYPKASSQSIIERLDHCATLTSHRQGGREAGDEIVPTIGQPYLDAEGDTSTETRDGPTHVSRIAIHDSEGLPRIRSIQSGGSSIENRHRDAACINWPRHR